MIKIILAILLLTYSVLAADNNVTNQCLNGWTETAYGCVNNNVKNFQEELERQECIEFSENDADMNECDKIFKELTEK